MYTTLTRRRITELRLLKNLSEYRLSIELGHSKGYIQSISSGHSLPSLESLFAICDYFHISPADFFAECPHLDSPQILRILSCLRQLSTQDLTTIQSIAEDYLEMRKSQNKPHGIKTTPTVRADISY